MIFSWIFSEFSNINDALLTLIWDVQLRSGRTDYDLLKCIIVFNYKLKTTIASKAKSEVCLVMGNG
jgi:hypothetical protein